MVARFTDLPTFLQLAGHTFGDITGSGEKFRQWMDDVRAAGSTVEGLVNPGGLTGATQATRWVGATSSGAPTSGTFAIGDFVIDRSGIVWICTTAGTPGTWTDASSSGHKLGYAEITATQSTTAAATNTTAIDATGLIVTVTVGTRPILVQFTGAMRNNTAANGGTVWLVEAAAGDANRTPEIGGMTGYSVGANLLFNVSFWTRLAPSAGTHTYKIQFGQQVGGTATLFASAAAPAGLRVVQG
jgi:hypothetical protein